MSQTGNSKSKIQNPKSKIGYGDYLRFRDLILEYSGLHFPEKKRIDLETGLTKALAEASPGGTTNGAYNLDSYYNLLRDKDDPTSKTEMSRLINILTIGETHFFRDEPQFNALANHVLPDLIARKRAAAMAVGPDIRPQLRIWSAGCATGEEPYSIAILLKELLPDINNWHILILATDINDDSLARAGEAVYSNWSFRENRAKVLRPHYFTRYFESNTPANRDRYQLRDDIRQMVTFTSLNLIEDDYPAVHNNTVSIDLIMCRNVTIYFTEEITRQVVKRFYRTLNRDGWLVVGHSEPSLLTYRDFQARNFPDTLLYQKTGQPSAWPADWEMFDPAPSAKPSSTSASSQVNQVLPNDFNSNLNVTLPVIGNSFSEPRTSEGNHNGPNAAYGEKKVISTLHTNHHPSGSKNNSSPPKPRPTTPLTSPEPDSYQLAKVFLNKGHVEEAIGELQRKLATTPNYAPAHSLLGLAYANLGRWAEAQQWCQSALTLDSLQAEAYYVLALVYQHEDQIEAAIDMLKKAIYLERDTPLPHFNLAMLYKKVGQIKKARRSFLNAIRILEKWSPERVVPDSGGATAKHLLEIAQQIVSKLENS